MEIRITKKCLVAALSRTAAIADRKSSMQILSNVLIEASDRDQVRISATNINLFVTGLYPAEIISSGAVTIPAKTAYDVTRNMPDGIITIKTEGEQVSIFGGRSSFQLLVMPPEDFPIVPDISHIQFFDINTAVIHRMIEQTSFSISTDETRNHLTGAFFQGDGKNLRMVTTDGHRLSKVEIKVDEVGFYNFSMIIPNKGITEIKHLVEDEQGTVQAASQDGSVFFRRSLDLDNSGQDPLVCDVMLVSKLIEDEFPPYDQVIPKSNEKTVIISRSSLLESLRRVTVVSEDKNLGVRFDFSDGLLKIETNNPAVGHGSEQLDVSFEGENLTIGFNAKYLIDIISVLRDDEIKMDLSGSLDPVVIRDLSDYFIGVVMPMRI